jgi:hypothetical protein
VAGGGAANKRLRSALVTVIVAVELLFAVDFSTSGVVLKARRDKR